MLRQGLYNGLAAVVKGGFWEVLISALGELPTHPRLPTPFQIQGQQALQEGLVVEVGTPAVGGGYGGV